MDRINCLKCNKPIEFPSYIDPNDYDGQIRCQSCNQLLNIKLKLSQVLKYNQVQEKSNNERNINITYELKEPKD